MVVDALATAAPYAAQVVGTAVAGAAINAGVRRVADRYNAPAAQSAATGSSSSVGLGNREWVSELQATSGQIDAIGQLSCFTLDYNMRNWNGDINHPVLFAQYHPPFNAGKSDELVIGIINVGKNTIRTVTFAGKYSGETVIVQNSEIVPSMPTFESNDGGLYATAQGVAAAKTSVAGATAAAKAGETNAKDQAARTRDALNKAYKDNETTAKSIAWVAIPTCKLLTMAAGSYLGVSVANTYVGDPGSGVLGYVSYYAAKKWTQIASIGGFLVGGLLSNKATNVAPFMQNIAGTYTAKLAANTANSTMYYARQMSDNFENMAIKSTVSDGNAAQHLFATSYKEGLYKKAELDYKRVQALAPNYRIERETHEILTSWHYLSTACVFGAMHSNRHNVHTAGLSGWQTGVWPEDEPLSRAVQIENYRASFSDVDSVADAQIVEAVDGAERGTVALVALSASVLDGDGPARAAAQLLGVTKWDTQWTPAKTVVRGGRTAGYKIPDGRTRSTVETYDLEMYRISKLSTPKKHTPPQTFMYLFNFPEPGVSRKIKFDDISPHLVPSELFRIMCNSEGAQPIVNSAHFPRVAAIAALWEPAAVTLPVDDNGKNEDRQYPSVRSDVPHADLTRAFIELMAHPNLTWGYYGTASDNFHFEQDRRRFVRALLCARGVGFTFIARPN